jgi:dolichol-phosphate mannosyltransferase
MLSAPLRLSIVIPTFNERSNVTELVSRLEATLGATGWEAVFVDDDSPDDTAALVRAMAQSDRRVRCLQRIGRRGLASACIDGMLASAGPIIAVMDADLQHDEAILPTMLSAIEGGHADIVVGTRYADGGGTGTWARGRATLSRIATAASRAVLTQRVSDPMSGFFMLRRSVLEATVRDLSGLGFKILLDILTAGTHPLRVVEVPYKFRERLSGHSKLDGFVAWEYGMLLAHKLVGRWVPVRFLAYAIVGGFGVLIHMAALATALKALHSSFVTAQSVATATAMVCNFALNNVLTYRDRRLKGRAWLRGLATFMGVCGVGAVANVGIATHLFEGRTPWALAGLAGVLVGGVWNYAVTQSYTWRWR